MRHVLLLLAFLGDAKPLSKKEQLRREKRDRECAHGERSGGCENRAKNVTRAFPVDEAPAVVDDRAAAAREWAKSCLLYTSPSPRDRG